MDPRALVEGHLVERLLELDQARPQGCKLAVPPELDHLRAGVVAAPHPRHFAEGVLQHARVVDPLPLDRGGAQRKGKEES